MVSEDQEKSAILNRYFTSVFVEEQLFNIPQLRTASRTLPVIQEVEMNEDVVRQKLSQLNCSSSPDPDQIHPRVLKEATKQLAKPLSLIFRKSINTGCLPDDWKLGHVVPIFKKGDRHNPENYRPIGKLDIHTIQNP